MKRERTTITIDSNLLKVVNLLALANRRSFSSYVEETLLFWLSSPDGRVELSRSIGFGDTKERSIARLLPEIVNYIEQEKIEESIRVHKNIIDDTQ